MMGIYWCEAYIYFFFSSRRRHTRFDCDWSSDVCSSDLKLAGELFVRAELKQHFIVRTSAIYGKQPCRAKGGLNFVELMLKLARERGEVRVVDSEFVTPTPTPQLAQQIVALSRCECYGLYHATAEGSCSWFEFAQEIFAVTGTPVRLTPAKAGDFPV